jgi:catechol 2,3-dioxygenase-like lactoylglutathione lyase family enzyme
LVLDCRNPEALADFWCQVLGFVVLQTDEDGSVEIGPAGTDPDDPGLTLVFSRSSQPKQAKLPLHFDVNAVDRNQDEELQRLLGLGARKADVGQTGEESWHVLADPEGNEFCLLRRTVTPDNWRGVASCGPGQLSDDLAGPGCGRREHDEGRMA